MTDTLAGYRVDADEVHPMVRQVCRQGFSVIVAGCPGLFAIGHMDFRIVPYDCPTGVLMALFRRTDGAGRIGFSRIFWRYCVRHRRDPYFLVMSFPWLSVVAASDTVRVCRGPSLVKVRGAPRNGLLLRHIDARRCTICSAAITICGWFVLW